MRYILVSKEEVEKLSKNRLQNIHRINRKWLYQYLTLTGCDTSEGFKKILKNYIYDEFWGNMTFQTVLGIVNNIEKRLNENKTKFRSN